MYRKEVRDVARGKKYPDEIKEKAYLMYATCGNIEEVSRALNVPASTLSGWLKAKARDSPDEFEELRREKKIDFIKQSSSIIDKGLMLLDRRFERALKQETELDELLDEIESAGKEEISVAERKNLIAKIRSLQLHDVKSITTAIGTLYDKRALAKGESTENTQVEFKLPKDMMRYAE